MSTLPPALLFNTTADEYLKSVENAAALELLPSLIILGLLAVLGNVGNGLALYVYYRKFKPSSTRTYILAMSVFDILFNTLSLPGEIIDLRFSMTYNAYRLCRLHRLITGFLTLISGFILVAVAVDRRRRICHTFLPPLTDRKVYVSLLVCGAVAFALGVPFSIMNGRHSVETGVPGVVGSACSVDDQFIRSSFPLVYNVILLVVFLVCAGTMITSYVQIARKVIKHKRMSRIGSKQPGGGTIHRFAMALKLKLDSHGSSADNDSPSTRTKGSGHLETSSDKKHKDGESDSGLSSNVSGAKHMHNDNCGIEVEQADDIYCGTPSGISAAELENHQGNGVHDVKDDNDNDEVFEMETTEKASTVSTETVSRSKMGSVRFESLQRVEEEFEVAVKTLAHAVSEDWLRSSEQFSHKMKDPSVKRRSRSVSEELFHVSYISEFIKQNYEGRVRCITTAELKADAETPCDVVMRLTSSHTQIEKGTSDVNSVTQKHCDVIASLPSTKPERRSSLPKDFRTDNQNDVFKATSDRHTSGSSNKTTSVIKVRKTASASRADKLHSLALNTLRRVRTKKSEGHDDAGGRVASSTMRRHCRNKIPSRTTWMMFVLTAIFVISYLPYLTIISVRAVKQDVEVGLSGWRLNVYTIALKSYFINSVVNPVVYSFCSARFRQQCRNLCSYKKKFSING